MSNPYDAMADRYRTNGDGKTINTVLGPVQEKPRPKPIPRVTIGELQRQFPKLYEPIVDGLFRAKETVNIISVSKIGKSWLAYNLALSIITGRDWFGRFKTLPGKILLIDNELHKPTIAHRLKTVADAMGIGPEQYADKLEVLALRGNLRDIDEIAVDLDEIPPGTFKAIIFDAKYRMLKPGTSENDNAAETSFYNTLDRYAEQLGASLICIHHSSKGSQADKRITDVGAGAGAQSRAADCHIILREHEDPGTVVLEAAVRSFAPVDPVPLRWVFPLWIADDGIDATRLRGRLTNQESKQNDKDKQGMEKIVKSLEEGPATVRKLRSKTGLSRERCIRLLDMLTAEKRVDGTELNVGGRESMEYFLPPG